MCIRDRDPWIFRRETSASDHTGSYQRLPSGDGARRCSGCVRRTAQSPAVGRHIARFSITLHDLSHKRKRGNLATKQPMAMDGCRSRTAWRRQRALRQVSPPAFPTARRPGMVFVLSMHHHVVRPDGCKTMVVVIAFCFFVAMDDPADIDISDRGRHSLLLFVVARWCDDFCRVDDTSRQCRYPIQLRSCNASRKEFQSKGSRPMHSHGQPRTACAGLYSGKMTAITVFSPS